ncbi:exodeoxyribonuclease VII small subunit [Catalinimonas alkaloidigena]|uniref:Exodeoxyribonuclease VII small subunit n=1 Tax=Catalinimonas alkaloidigena TaxID=1075417 RepID=A0A1G9LP21_9BACT|nr:exodeoxyribonuclease VII small subunit [Catalinimonas alkaloidigena]SDL63749.1 exodeoxyribonuclease VII small subunit [Catalinimonas alkaloidigena]
MEEPLTFEAAQQELETLLEDLEGDVTRIDDLLEKVKRARTLIDFCRIRLRQVEAATDELLDEEGEA